MSYGPKTENRWAPWQLPGSPQVKPYEAWPDSLGREAQRLGSNTSGRSFPTVPGKLGLQRLRLCAALLVTSRANSRSGILSSGSGAIVVVQHATQPLLALHFTCGADVPRLWADEAVPQALMIAFPVIVRYEALNGGPQGPLSKKDQPIQAGLLDAASNRSAWAFKFGDRGGSFTDSTPVSAIIFKNSANSGSRS